jgi:transcriptional regulator with XRE-family HTH domain
MKTRTDPEIGEQIRQARRNKKLTLERLAARSGVSRSVVSQIERGETNPTLGTLLGITRALQLDITKLVGDGIKSSEPNNAAGDIEHVRANLTPSISSTDGNCRIDILNPPWSASSVEWYKMNFQPGSVLESDPHSAGSVEHLTVIEGKVDVWNGSEWVTAQQDETVRYRADRRHAIANPHPDPAKVIVVVLYPQ